MTLIDGVKSKAQIPLYDANIAYGTDTCDLTKNGSGDLTLGEKEISVSDFTWYISNCKKTLEGTYRSALLRKGSLNEQTLDDDYKEWLYDYIAKSIGVKAVSEAAAQIKAKVVAATSAEGVEKSIYVATSGSDILAKLRTMYKGFSKDLLNAFYSDADKEFKPTIYMNAAGVQEYQLAMADKYTTVPTGIIEGAIPAFMGMPVKLFNSLGDGEIIITTPANMLLITDDYGDMEAIQVEYTKKKNTDEFFGNFKLGFDVRRGDMVVHNLGSAASAASTK
jgi:hypothetical protein